MAIPGHLLSRFPAEHPLRSLLPALVDEDPERRDQAFRDLRVLVRLPPPGFEGLFRAGGPELDLSLDIQLAVIAVVGSVEFPQREDEWEDIAALLMELVLLEPRVELIQPGVALYGTANENVRLVLLSLFGATESREGAEAFARCVGSCGWPGRTQPRVFKNLGRLLDHAPILFPALLDGAPVALTDALVAALSQGKLPASALAPASQALVDRLAAALDAARGFQQHAGVAWRFGEEYWATRSDCGAILDIAGWLPRDVVLPLLLSAAADLTDPRLLLFAVGALLRQRADPPVAALERIARAPETCRSLFQLLDELGELDRFPEAWRTESAFAAADMVEWLIYPTELGREPDELECMGVYVGEENGQPGSYYLWRFRNPGEDFCGEWTAGVSGPYPPADGPPEAHYGGSTFSCFDAWDSLPPLGHLARVVDTPEDWQRRDAPGG